MMSNNRNMHSSPPKLHAVSEFHPVDDYELDFPVLSSQPSEPTHLTKKVEDLQSQFKEVKRYFKALLRIELEQYEHAAILIQSHYRGYLVRKHIQQNELLSRYRQSLKLPAAVHFTLDELLKLCGNVGSKETQPQTGPSTFAVVKIQSVYRGHLIRKYVRNYKLSRESAIKIQSLWRGYRIRKHSKVTVAILKSLCYKSLELVRRLTAQVDSVEEKLYQVSQKRREDEEKMGHLIEETKSLKSIKEKYEDLVQSGNSNQQQKAIQLINVPISTSPIKLAALDPMTYSSEPSTQSSNARPNPLFTTPTKLSSITKSESTVGQLEDDLDDESSTASSPQVELDEDQVNVQGSDLSHTPSRSLTEQLENIRTISLSDTANGNANTSFVSDLGDISSLSIAEEAFLARLDVSLSAKKRKSSSLNSFASSSTSGNLANFGLNNQTKNGAVENSEEKDAVAKDGESEEYVSMVDYNYLKAEVELLRAGFEKLQLVVNELVVGNRDASK